MRRRSFLIAATLATGGLMVGCAGPARQSLRRAELPLKDGQIALNGWVKVAPDGTVTAVMGKSEMGQGVHTALMMLVAEELDCAWAQMRFEAAPVDPLYGNVLAFAEGVPLRPDDRSPVASNVRWAMQTVMRQFGFMMTGGSTSIKEMWLPMRQAAAVTRATLVEAAARAWSVPPAQVSVRDGVLSGPGRQSMSLGEAVRLLGPKPRPASNYTLKQPGQFRLIGQSLPRNDSKAKTEGVATFGIDVQRPGTLYAAVRMSPVAGGKVVRFDGAKARALPGVRGIVAFGPESGGSGGVAVVADRYWTAVKALRLVDIRFEDGPMKRVSSAAIERELSTLVNTESGHTFWNKGNAASVIASSKRTIRSEYKAPYLAHATMEPMNCTVEYLGDRANVWVPTQVPGFARTAVARALNLPAHLIDVHVTYLGGGFGRRLEVDFVAQAATIAREFRGRPVQVLWSREEDMQHDFYRPACASRFTAAFGPSGEILAWQNVSAGQALVPAYMSRNAGLPTPLPDKSASEGAYDQPYEFPNARVSHVRADYPVPVGFWRAVGHSHHGFFKESFLDECAHVARADPLGYRLDLLKNHPRQRAVLELAAEKAGWGRPLPNAADGAKQARGIALHESFGAVVAQVAEVSVGANGEIRVHRVVCAIDCGLPVNPGLIRQQMESAVVFALSAALHGRIDIDNGRVQQGNFHDYEVLRFNACPVVETHIVASTQPPEGVGEPGVPPLAPAVANALFVLTGQRLRSLPLQLTT